MQYIGKTILMVAALCGITTGAAELMVADVDVREMAPGDEITVPVHATGLTPETFAAFQLTVAYDTDVLEFVSAERGDLIAMTDPTWAADEYAPGLWALEARASQARVAVAGMILLDGVSVAANNLAQLDAARVTAADGVLVNLHFELIQQTPSSLLLADDATVDTLILTDLLTDTSSPATAVPGNSIPGGVITSGLPNWWQLEHFSQVGIEPTDDPDTDTFSNEYEYQNDTDPKVADALVTLVEGWNLVSFPVDPQNPDLNAVMDNGKGGVVHSGDVYEWTPTRDGDPYQPASIVTAQVGYSVYLAGYKEYVVHVSGTFGAGTVRLTAGWNVVGPVRQTAPPEGLGTFWWWDPNRELFRAVDGSRGEMLQPGRAYWVFSEVDNYPLDLGR